jgi:hypothetical protein
MSRRHYFKNINFSCELESDQLSKYINKLEQRIEEKSQSPSNQTGLAFPPHPNREHDSYKEFLEKQMIEKNNQKLKQKQERSKPGIDEKFYGYPDLPQTPREIRRQRELLQMQQLRKDLSEQLAYKHQSFNSLKYKELESDRTNNDLDYKIYVDQKNMGLIKKKQERETLVKAWDQAKKARDLQNLIETADRKGIAPSVTKSIRSFDNESQRKTEDYEAQAYFDSEVRSSDVQSTPLPSVSAASQKKIGVKEKALRLRESIEMKEKNTYRYKIKQLVKDAKIQRQNNKNRISVSPVLGKFYQNNGKSLNKLN